VNAPSNKVTFVPLRKTAEAKTDETILDAARRAGVPIGNSCGANGICARCRVRILSGAENLTPPTAIETRIAQRLKLESDERLACQAVPIGDCAATTSYW